jgi:hypothetical protein
MFNYFKENTILLELLDEAMSTLEECKTSAQNELRLNIAIARLLQKIIDTQNEILRELRNPYVKKGRKVYYVGKADMIFELVAKMRELELMK